MNSNTNKYFRILAVSPSTYGFGFVVLEGSDMLVEWAAKSPRTGNKNYWCLAQAQKLMGKYDPDALILYDHEKNPRRSVRIKELNERLAELAEERKIPVKLLPLEKVQQAFFPAGEATKHGIATILAGGSPDELASKLPPKRREWTSEDRRMDIFDAMALAVAFRRQKNRPNGEDISGTVRSPETHRF